MGAISYLSSVGLAADILGGKLRIQPASLLTDDLRQFVRDHLTELKDECREEAAHKAANLLCKPRAYLLEHDDHLAGGALFSLDDLAEIGTSNRAFDALRYLVSMEVAHPHLKERLRHHQPPAPSSGHPLFDALDKLTSEGLQILHDDRRYIRGLIGHQANWKELLSEYAQCWRSGMDAEPVAHMRQNRGRVAANDVLRVRG